MNTVQKRKYNCSVVDQDGESFYEQPIRAFNTAEASERYSQYLVVEGAVLLPGDEVRISLFIPEMVE